MIEMERAADTSSEISLVERRGWRRFLLRDHATEVAGLTQGDNPKPSPPDASYRARKSGASFRLLRGGLSLVTVPIDQSFCSNQRRTATGLIKRAGNGTSVN